MIKILLMVGAFVLPVVAVIRVFKNAVPWYSEQTKRAIRGDEPVPIQQAGCLHDFVSIILFILGVLCFFGWVSL